MGHLGKLTNETEALSITFWCDEITIGCDHLKLATGCFHRYLKTVLNLLEGTQAKGISVN
jgi:hypothetical protein